MGTGPLLRIWEIAIGQRSVERIAFELNTQYYARFYSKRFATYRLRIFECADRWHLELISTNIPFAIASTPPKVDCPSTLIVRGLGMQHSPPPCGSESFLIIMRDVWIVNVGLASPKKFHTPRNIAGRGLWDGVVEWDVLKRNVIHKSY